MASQKQLLFLKKLHNWTESKIKKTPKNTNVCVPYKDNNLQEVLTSLNYIPTIIHFVWENKTIKPRIDDQYYSFRKLDVNSSYDINFTYEILKQRYKKEGINFDKNGLPSLESHISFLKTRFKYFYICSFNKCDIAIIYVIKHNNELGFFYNYKCLKTAHNMYQDIFNTKEKLPRVGALYFCISCIRQLIKKHKALKYTLKARVLFTNCDGIQGVINSGLEPIYIEYEYKK